MGSISEFIGLTIGLAAKWFIIGAALVAGMRYGMTVDLSWLP